MYENRSQSKYFLEEVESIMTGEIKLPGNVLLGKACQWNKNVQVVKDKLVVKVSKIQELNILDFLGLWPVLNNLYFVVRHSEARRRKDIFQILY